MAVLETDIVVYGSASMPDDDTPTGIGGAVDKTKKIVFTDIVAATATINIVSDNAADSTQIVTIYGRLSTGVITSEALNLNGTTTVLGATVFERILKIVANGTHAGAITVTENGGGVLATMEGTDTETTAVLEIRRPFYNAVAESSSGVARTYYEKIFFTNNNAVSALTSATIEEVAGGVADSIEFDLETVLDGTDTNGVGNRQTHTGGYTFDSATKAVGDAGDGIHDPTKGQGVWLKLSLAAGDPATNSTYTLRETGETA